METEAYLNMNLDTQQRFLERSDNVYNSSTWVFHLLMCMYIHESTCVYECMHAVCMSTLRLLPGIFFDFTSTLFFDARDGGIPSNSELTNMASLSRQLALGSWPFTSKVRIPGRLPYPLDVYLGPGGPDSSFLTLRETAISLLYE